jgi:hypothetical protein
MHRNSDGRLALQVESVSERSIVITDVGIIIDTVPLYISPTLWRSATHLGSNCHNGLYEHHAIAILSHR